MRAFDWKTLFTQHRVPFIDRGANVKRDEINIKCPWCGNADPSFHLGINLGNGWYSCWRNRGAHSGKSPVRLVMKLLHLPYWKAREVCGLSEDFVDPEGFDAAAARIMGRESIVGRPAQIKRDFLAFDKYFLPIQDDGMRTRRHWNYLYMRGFDHEDIPTLCEDYQIMACREGQFAHRLIIPFFLDGKLVTWTGRAVAPSKIRYMDLDLDKALVPAKETLYNHDCIPAGGHVLVIVEGPLDALKLDFYGRHYGVRAVGLSTNSMTEHQTYMLESAISKFDHIGVMMDNQGATDGAFESMRMKQSLMFLGAVKTFGVPGGRKDAGECLPREIKTWSQQLTKVST